MEVSIDEVKLLLGERDLVIYHLTKRIAQLEKEANGRLEPAVSKHELRGLPPSNVRSGSGRGDNERVANESPDRIHSI